MPRKGVRVPQASRRARKEYKNATACAADLRAANERALAAAFWPPPSLSASIEDEETLTEEEEKQRYIAELKKKEERRRKRLKDEAKDDDPKNTERPIMKQPRTVVSKKTGKIAAVDWDGNEMEDDNLDRSKVAFDVIDPLTFEAEYEHARDMLIADGIDPDEEVEYYTDEEHDYKQGMDFSEGEIEEFERARAEGVLPDGCVVHEDSDGEMADVSRIPLAIMDLIDPNNEALEPELKAKLADQILAMSKTHPSPLPKASPAMEAKLALKPAPKSKPPPPPAKSPPPALKAKLALKLVSPNSRPPLPAPSSPPTLEARGELQPTTTFERPLSPSRSSPALKGKIEVKQGTTLDPPPVPPPLPAARGRSSLALEPTLAPIPEFEHSPLPVIGDDAAPELEDDVGVPSGTQLPSSFELDVETVLKLVSTPEAVRDSEPPTPSKSNGEPTLETCTTSEPASEPSTAPTGQPPLALPRLLRRLSLKAEAKTEPSPTIDPPYSVPDPELILRQMTNERYAAIEALLSHRAASQRRFYRISDEHGVVHTTQVNGNANAPTYDYSAAEVELLDRMMERARSARRAAYEGYVDLMAVSRLRGLRAYGRIGI